MLIVFKLVLVLKNNSVLVFVLFVLFCTVIFVITQVYILFVHFPALGFSLNLSLNLCLLLLLLCLISFFIPLLDLHMLIAWFTKVQVYCFLFRYRSAVHFFVFVNFSNALLVFVMYLNLRVHLFVFARLVFVAAQLLGSIYLCADRYFFTVVFLYFSLILINLLILICFSDNGFNVGTYMQFIVHVTRFIGSLQDLTGFVHFVSISIFVVFLGSFFRPCCACVLEFCFARGLEFQNFVFYPTSCL